MDELVARIVAAGLTSAVFTWLSVKLWVRQFIDESEKPVTRPKFKTNVAAGLFAVVWGFLLTFLLNQSLDPVVLGEWILTSLVAAGVATYGHEAVKNYGRDVTVGDVTDSSIAIGEDAESTLHE